jgi:hypothetical protein
VRKMALLIVLAFAVVPAALAEDSPTPSQQASTLCKQQRTAVGPNAFTLLYGGGKNAYGRCVSKLASTVSHDVANAAKQCAAERANANFATEHGQTFAQFYGTGPHGNNAYGRCVSSKAKTLVQEQQEATVSAAKTCKAERTSLGATQFNAKYGNKANAFGKCVSKTAKATP